uniref:Elongation of very long chain fatty acids protein n=1 Tax=Platychelipus littoralis TaxID=2593136 RepID=A0A9E8LRC7_9MAXI|nr:fatty acid elongase elovl1a [Platychelipus littoralis]
MNVVSEKWVEYRDLYDQIWEKRDRRVDGWLFMSSPLPTILLCATYVYIVKVAGPNYMRNKKPMNIRSFLIVYNLFQIVLSTYIFVGLLLNGWGGDYSFTCQPVDYSNNPRAIQMAFVCWMYYMSKFTEFFDTFCFVARKKYSHVSLLHVVHHGIMPLSVWPGARFVPGGHASFFGLLNTFVHIFMYTYYFMAALGPQYQKYIWWKQHMTTLQMIQFIGIMVHAFQLVLYDDCDFPWQFSYFIGAHAVMFFILFSQFYIQAYLTKKPHQKKTESNGVYKNGTHSSDKKQH